MVSLENLKDRLTALPDKRKRAELGERFAVHLAQAKVARQKLESAITSSAFADEALPSKAYLDVASRVRKAAQQALRLRDDLTADSGRIADNSIENRFALLSEHASGALDQCKAVWKKEVESKVGNWVALSGFVRNILPKEGRELQSAVTSLQGAMNMPPASATDSKRIQGDLRDLTRLVNALDLEGTFGQFLRATASGKGAKARLLLDADVQKKLEEYKLWDVFSVRIS